ncbi:MAG: hypothetical protein CL441_07755 [Acidimicrobiaceae bacterium]|nr:hypothetical protein [Acidimicrobiaceae bacterium]
MSGFGPTILRLVVGAVSIAHGLITFVPAPPGAAESIALLLTGVSRPEIVTMILGGLEVAGGAMLVVGAFTRWVAPVLALATAAVSWQIRVPHGLFLNWALEPGVAHGYEFDLLLIAALVSLWLTGSGNLSFDRARRRAAETEAAARARLQRR